MTSFSHLSLLSFIVNSELLYSNTFLYIMFTSPYPHLVSYTCLTLRCPFGGLLSAFLQILNALLTFLKVRVGRLILSPALESFAHMFPFGQEIKYNGTRSQHLPLYIKT